MKLSQVIHPPDRSCEGELAFSDECVRILAKAQGHLTGFDDPSVIPPRKRHEIRWHLERHPRLFAGVQLHASKTDEAPRRQNNGRSEEHTSELQSRGHHACRL